MFAFSRLLFYWKGSIYKLIYKEMIVFCLLYATLSLNYRFILREDQKRCCFAESDTILEVMQGVSFTFRVFERIVRHCDKMASYIPLSFVLGFYVSIVITRWWSQYVNIPWPDRSE